MIRAKIIPNQLNRAASLPYSRGNQRSIVFGHAPKPQPEDTKEWAQTFFLDLFKPHQIIPRKPDPTDPPAPLANKNVVQKVWLWFQALAQGFLKDLKDVWRHCRPGSKTP